VCGVKISRRISCVVSSDQGLILVQFLAQRKRLEWDMGVIEGLFRRCRGVTAGV